MDRNLKIGIVGLGLIGGSIFKALCALKCNVYGATQSNLTLKKARKYSENVSRSLNLLKNVDIIFVCTPINQTTEVLDKLNEILPPDVVVSDVSSLKQFVTKKKYKFNFIPGHPMAGTEFSGFDASFETLFQHAKWVLTPFKSTDKKSIKSLTDVIEVLGAKPIFTTPDEHDKAVALISHMPMLVAQAIFKNASDNKLALKLASSGFRDMTRLAMTNSEMAQDMINMNSAYIQESLLSLYSTIGELLDNDYETQIKKLAKERQVMYLNGKNIL